MEAKTVFDDVNAVYIPDDEHSQEEERFIVLGESQTQKLLVVCYCERKNGKTRIFSARKAEKKEKNYYVGEQL
ncbi:MAG: BrnT family toxin [Oscillospiraceae bacterium]|nr:BrnT family toxin [Oscillospiraceae bacterium]